MKLKMFCDPSLIARRSVENYVYYIKEIIFVEAEH